MSRIQWKQPELLELCRHIAMGLNSKEIAEAMEIPEKKVQSQARELLGRVMRTAKTEKVGGNRKIFDWSPDKVLKVYSHLAKGRSFIEISKEVGVPPHTIRSLIDKQRKRFGAKSRIDLVYHLTKNNLV